jgi:hypothetical protein
MMKCIRLTMVIFAMLLCLVWFAEARPERNDQGEQKGPPQVKSKKDGKAPKGGKGKQDKSHIVEVDLNRLPPGLARSLLLHIEGKDADGKGPPAHAKGKGKAERDEKGPPAQAKGKGKGKEGKGKKDKDVIVEVNLNRLPPDLARSLLRYLEDRDDDRDGPPRGKGKEKARGKDKE